MDRDGAPQPEPAVMTAPPFRHVRDLWDDAAAAGLDPVGRLVYRSNLLGADQRITNTGGGNTSSKLTEADPLTGEPVEVLWVKGSGGDLRTATREQLRLAVPGEAARPPADLRRPPGPGAEVAGRGRHGRAVPPLHVQPQPAGGVDRHAAARVHPAAVRRSHPPERGHRPGRVGRRRAADPRGLRRRRWSYTPWLRPGFELGLRMQADRRASTRRRGASCWASTASSTGPTTTAPATAPRWT